MPEVTKAKLFLQYLTGHKIKINVGSAGINSDDSWFATDIYVLDITKEHDWKKMFSFIRLNNIMAEHVWEHLNEDEAEFANLNCFRYLKKNGRLRIAVPDGFHPDKNYINYVKPGGCGAGADDHKILYNYKLLKKNLESAGFIVELLEYWDEEHKFHFINWTDEGGHIRRSKRYDERNRNEGLNYTSLIVDAVKP